MTHYQFDDCYLRMFLEMMLQSKEHAKYQQLSECDFGDNKKWAMQEVFMARCYILSRLFEDDCLLVDKAPDYPRRQCYQFFHETGCFVCGRKDDKYQYDGHPLCWEHNKITTEFDKGRDPAYQFQREDDSMMQIEIAFITDGIKPLKITNEDSIAICADYIRGKTTQKEVARKYHISPRYVRNILQLAGANN